MTEELTTLSSLRAEKLRARGWQQDTDGTWHRHIWKGNHDFATDAYDACRQEGILEECYEEFEALLTEKSK